jgi:hypothetical protein
MAKLKSSYQCQSCGVVLSKWAGQCPECQDWNCVVETVSTERAGARFRGFSGQLSNQVRELSAVGSSAVERLPVGVGEIDALHRMYLESEISDDPRAQRAAAVAPSGTRFGRYRLGCDAPQLDALRRETSAGPRFRAQEEMCAGLFGCRASCTRGRLTRPGC